MKKQGGFSLVEGLLIILIVGVVGFAGYTVWNNGQDDELTETTSDIQYFEGPCDPNVEQSPVSCYDPDDNSEDIVEQTVVSSVSCRQLNVGESIAEGVDATWKERLENSDEISSLINSYDDNTNYETYFARECTLDDNSVLISYSHYTSVINAEGTVDSIYTKGVAQFKDANVIFVDTNSPCDNGPPDATSPPAITRVEDNIALIACNGYVDRTVEFNLATKKYEL